MTFVISTTDFGHYQFCLSLGENVLLNSLVTFPTLKHCKDSIQLLKECLNKANSLCSTFSSIGGHYFYVCDERRDPIAMSDIFSSKASMKRSMQLILRNASTANIEDQLLQEIYQLDRKTSLPDMVA
jgi:hypothetical protein